SSIFHRAFIWPIVVAAYTQTLASSSFPQHYAGPNLPLNANGRSFFSQFTALLTHPQRILLLWNWKSAYLSIALRAPIFFVAAIRRGATATLSAVLTECVYCMITAGFYGAVVQNLRNARPAWLTALFLAFVLPSTFQILEFLLHRARGTPHLRIAEIVSITISAISSLFNWYAMRRGALLVGSEGTTFRSDLRRLPGLLLKFVMELPNRAKARKATSTLNE